MPDSITVGRDFVQTIKGMSGGLVLGIVGLFVLGFVLIVYLLVPQLAGDPDPVVVSLPPSSTPIVASSLSSSAIGRGRCGGPLPRRFACWLGQGGQSPTSPSLRGRG